MLEFNGQHFLDGRASNPNALGWMRGAPPPADKRITFESDEFLNFPQLRWSLSHMRELVPSVNVWRGRGGPALLERSDKTAEIDALTFADANGRMRRFDEALYDTYTDGIVVLHRGRIVYERYFGALERHLPHALHSVTKSYAGTIAAALVHEGVLDDSKALAHYLPELRGSAFEDATLRQVMDMQTGLDYSENYADRHASFWAHARACGWRPRPAGYSGPQTLFDYLCTLRKKGVHGEFVDYKTVNTDVLAWVMNRVTGHSFAQLLHERLWAPLGCEEDGYVFVDSAGTAMAGAGLSATVRDLARFGELMRRHGEWNGKQLIPSSVIEDVQNGDAPSKFAYEEMQGYAYRSQWWVTHDELAAFLGRGMHGQLLYIAPRAEMVVARLASHPVAGSSGNIPITLPQMLELGRALSA
ncbi:MAG: class C beta-lactamase-related serine hydrolase [Mesorhizobium sp.]|uniref:serine hydrolase domain-containing protein n=1 Tax=unclassified Mesorhizobium TaxID=325217 RepID=UPI000F75A164|nr:MULTISPECIES: serine hydrolase [unclassified Mesorhizobium]AZN98033.1 class C beta-lactamase-related serine hydrolase [Mesorhizobium sp. M9A.F.Ca.ET.002.03.1.2]AZO19547.1 class C beta-lactamase-related serine hydrolase [Mesorhizobium sp. M1E.F.Ca.ET.045.02.1.1]RWB51025.1 MAG: class C beta-lactamase-related serine hydrolase [Mesorhizobium sp.]RWJ38169.1 MAG: class C beta-lactamase-related serine hydrolase [Mesorhizobium sp.]RWJ78549.1 MAG: class C beta-lactamase-related serine hydrolase [Mes